MMIKRLFPILFAGALFSFPAAAQTLPALAPPAQRFEGTITSVNHGVELKATLKFQAPDSLRIDTQANAPALVEAQTLIAAGDQTLLFDPQTRRVQRLPYNITRQAWRGAGLGLGGAANIALFGLNQAALGQFYNSEAAANGAIFTAKPEAGWLVRDYARSGGDSQGHYYAVYKRRVWDIPQRLQLKVNNGLLMARTELDAQSKPLFTTSIEYGTAKLPTKATVRDAQNRIQIEFNYALKPVEAAFAESTFTLGDAAKDQIVEDAELKPLTAYAGKADAASRFNLGIALAKHTEDFIAVKAALDQAAKMQPKATAPLFALYDAGIVTRDLARASRALDRLGQLLGEGSFYVAFRRANIAAARRDWAGAGDALATAQKAQPQNLAITLLRAQVLRNAGKPAEAQPLLLDILKSDAPQDATQVAAAETLAESVWNSGGHTEIDDLLAMLPSDTQWQKLARAHLALWKGEAAVPTDLSNPLALASAAVALEREKRDDAATKIWQSIAASSEDGAIVANAHLEMLAARKGDALASLRSFRTLTGAAIDEATRQREADLLLEAWRKNFRQLELRTALQARTISGDATDTDARAWLTYLDSNGPDDQIGTEVHAAAGRFDNSAYWHSRLAEQLLIERDALPPKQTTGRANLLKEANEDVQRAVQLDPGQPYYAMQSVLIALQRAGEKSVIIDANEENAKRQAATDALANLAHGWPGDTDASLLFAIGTKELNGKGTADMVEAIEAALLQGAPGRETVSGDRHATAFFAQQTITSGWRKLRQWDAAERGYQNLLLSSRTAQEELGIGINYITMLLEKAGKDGNPDVETLAELFERAVREPWSYADSQMLLQNYAGIIARNPGLAAQISRVLLTGNAARKVAGAQLLFETEKTAGQAADAPNAPAASIRLLREIQTAVGAASDALVDIASGDDKLVAGRAVALLAERSLAMRSMKEALAYLKTAIVLEPQDLSLRLAYARALQLAGQKPEAIAVRDAILRTFRRDGSTLRQVAALSLQLDSKDDAVRLATLAFNSLQATRDASPSQVEVASFTLARALMAHEQQDAAIELYKKLAGEQWADADRAAALLDWEAGLRAAGRNEDADAVHQKLDDLKASKAEMQQAQALIASLG